MRPAATASCWVSPPWQCPTRPEFAAASPLSRHRSLLVCRQGGCLGGPPRPPFATASDILGLGVLRDDLRDGPAQRVPADGGVVAGAHRHVWRQPLLNHLSRKGRDQCQGDRRRTRTETARNVSKAEVNKTPQNMQQSNGNYTCRAHGIIEAEDPPLGPHLVGGGHGYAVRRSGRPCMVERSSEPGEFIFCVPVRINVILCPVSSGAGRTPCNYPITRNLEFSTGGDLIKMSMNGHLVNRSLAAVVT